MNRFGLGERRCPNPDNDLHTNKPLLTLAYLHYWDKGMRVPADIAARLIEEGYDCPCATSSERSIISKVMYGTNPNRFPSSRLCL